MKKGKEKEKTKSEKIADKIVFSEKKLNRRIIFFFVFLCFLIYGKSIKNDYSMDDEFVIRNNQQVQRGIEAIPEIMELKLKVIANVSSYLQENCIVS